MAEPPILSVKFRSISLVCLIIACILYVCKYVELDENLPTIRDFLNLNSFEFSIDDIKKMESDIIHKINWKLKISCPFDFVNFHVNSGFIFIDDSIDNKMIEYKDYIDIKRKIMNLENEIIKNHYFLQFSPFIQGISCVIAGRVLGKIKNSFHKNFEKTYLNNKEDIEKCVESILKLNK